jgi:hypothetical protein
LENEVDPPHEKWGEKLIDTLERLVMCSKVGAYNYAITIFTTYNIKNTLIGTPHPNCPPI